MLTDYVTDMNHCLKCGACRTAFGPFMPICPSGLKYQFDSHYAIGRVELAKAVLDGRLELNSDLMSRVYTCTSCGGCDQQCGPTMGVFPLRIIEELKSEAMVKGLIPPRVRDFLKGMSVHGNPYLESAENRGKWADGLGVKSFSGQEYLFYVGCVGSYDEYGKRLSRALASLLLRAGLEFGILGAEEMCDGNEINRVGERGLYRFLAEQNIELFRQKGVKKIFTLSPHAYNALKNDYPQFGGEFQVFHYTEILTNLIANNALKPQKESKAKVTFHDPCFLGRHNGLFDPPREALCAIPGLSLVEMEMNRKNAFCCGGGGGNFFTDMLGGGPRSAARVRVRQALESGAAVMAVACPNCARMLDDAVKSEEAEGKLVVKDISEMLGEVC